MTDKPKPDRLVIDDPHAVSDERRSHIAEAFAHFHGLSPVQQDQFKKMAAKFASGGFVNGPAPRIPAMIPSRLSGATGRAMGFDLAEKDSTSVVVIMAQSGGQVAQAIEMIPLSGHSIQLAEVIKEMNDRVAKMTGIMGSLPCAAHFKPRTATEQAEIDRQRRAMSILQREGQAVDQMWRDPGADPFAAIKRWQERMMDEVRTFNGLWPDRITVPVRRWRRIETAEARARLSKRAFRRWRGRTRAIWRAEDRGQA